MPDGQRARRDGADVPATVRKGRRRVRAREAGQATLETVALLPFALFLLLLCGQLLLLGLSTAIAGAAAQEASRAVALGQDPGAAARSVIPDGMRSSSTVTSTSTSVRVVVRTPLQIGPGATRELPVGVDHTVVREPR